MADTIKEFLVALGFKVDQAGYKRFTEGLDNAEKSAKKLGSAFAATVGIIEAGVIRIAAQFEDLYYVSQRTGSSVANIQAWGYAAGQVGASADRWRESLEGLARVLRTQPGSEGLIANLGIQTREANGGLRDTGAILRDLVGRFRQMPFFLASQYAQTLGINPDTLLMLEQSYEKAAAKAKDFNERQKDAGINADAAAEKFMLFMNNVDRLASEIGILATQVATVLLPAADWLVTWAEKGVEWLAKLGVETHGVSDWVLALAGSYTALKLSLAALAPFARLLGFGGGAAAGAAAAGAGGAGAAAAGAGGALAGRSMLSRLLVGPVGGSWLARLGGIGAFLYSMSPSSTNDGEDAILKRLGLGLSNYHGAGSADQPNGPQAVATPGERALAYFQRMGWSREQAAGIVGNLSRESNFNPSAVGDQGQAYGIAQWHPDRQAAFARWAGHDIRSSTYDEQLGFINYELTEGGERAAGYALRRGQTAAQAGGIFAQQYERPSGGWLEWQKRGSLATDFLNSQPGGAGAPSVTITQKTDIHVSGSGDAGQAAALVEANQRRVNGDLVRDTVGAVQ